MDELNSITFYYMKIGIAGPLNVQVLNLKNHKQNLPRCHEFPMYALFINSLIKEGHTITAITISREIEETIIIEDDGIKLIIVPRKPGAGRRLFNYEIKEITKEINNSDIDIIHALWSYEFGWAATNSKIPNVITLQDHAYTILKYQFDFFRMARYLMNIIVLRKSSFLISNSKYLFELLSKKNKNKARIISNFYPKDLGNYYDTSSPKQNYIVTISSGYGKRKNVHNSILAFAILRKKYKNLKYRIIGTQMEPGGGAYIFATERNITDGIEFVGSIPFPEVIEQIKNAEAVVHPSLEESFGMAVLEPMIIGTPVIGGENSGNVPHLLQNDKTGITCDVNSPQSIADGIMKILDNKEFALKIKENAYNFVTQNFNESKIISQHIDYYKDIILATRKNV